MFSFHKPKIYRSNNGCCICRAKSSSSRFTDSTKYEQEFEKCFRIREKRCGEICNACVLLVKRWKKLPDGTSRHWNHVVDARAGPGTKSTLKIKNKLSPSMHKYKSPLKAKRTSSSSTAAVSSSASSPRQHSPSFPSIPSPLPEELSGYDDSLDKSDLFSRGPSDSEDSDNDDIHPPASRHISKTKTTDEQISPFLDLTYWKKTKVCCGTIFKGLNGEVLVDPRLLKPCWSCRKEKSLPKAELKRSSSLEDTDSNSSMPSYGGITDYYNPDTPEPETPPESPPNSPHTNLSEAEALTNLQCAGKMDFVSNCPITMEC